MPIKIIGPLRRFFPAWSDALSFEDFLEFSLSKYLQTHGLNNLVYIFFKFYNPLNRKTRATNNV